LFSWVAGRALALRRRLPRIVRPDASFDTLAARAGATEEMRIADLQPGWDVVTNDGHRLGTVREVGQHFIEVSGGFFSSALYVPSSAIGNVEDETVYLNLAHRQIDATGWAQPPRTSDELQTHSERDANREI